MNRRRMEGHEIMSDLPLDGLRILIVEDDYYLATDARAIIEGTGGQVVGPFGTAEEARAAIDTDGADLAVIDINLGCGPAFDLAHYLQSIKLPFLFATGYDQAVVPDDLRGIVRLEKPFRPAELIGAALSVHEAAGAAIA